MKTRYTRFLFQVNYQFFFFFFITNHEWLIDNLVSIIPSHLGTVCDSRFGRATNPARIGKKGFWQQYNRKEKNIYILAIVL